MNYLQSFPWLLPLFTNAGKRIRCALFAHRPVGFSNCFCFMQLVFFRVQVECSLKFLENFTTVYALNYNAYNE